MCRDAQVSMYNCRDHTPGRSGGKARAGSATLGFALGAAGSSRSIASWTRTPVPPGWGSTWDHSLNLWLMKQHQPQLQTQPLVLQPAGRTRRHLFSFLSRQCILYLTRLLLKPERSHVSVQNTVFEKPPSSSVAGEEGDRYWTWFSRHQFLHNPSCRQCGAHHK